MSSVDNRVVQMQFDNKQFENGIKTSTKSLDDLKKGLDLESSAKSLSNLDKVGRSFSLEGVSQGVDNLRSKFSALEIIGITALANITNSAINAGKSIISSLTVAPVSEGYQDYMRKITSIQTITNATGKSIKDVGTYFSQLDTYADKTIYNLDDMTSALAKFTNAGVDMDKSVPAIKGIANMVALAGQDAGAAQIAFYNLSQSIAGGFLTTTDYKSLNLANVATKEWKDQMIAGAIAAGTLKKTSKGLYIIKGSKEAVTDAALFNEELSKGWASTKVMLDVFGKYGNEQTAIGKKALSAAQDIKSFGMMMETLKAQVGTGWTDTFEILIGNLEESKALFTPLTNTISGFLEATSNARNNMLAFWKANGGREAVIQGIVNVFQALQAILKPVHDAFREVFPPATGDTLVIISKAFRDFTEKLKIGAQSLSGIKVIFKALFTVLDIGLKSLQLLLIPIGMLLKLLAPVGDGLLWILGIVSKYLVALSDSIDTTYLMNNASKKMGEAFTMIKETVNELITVLGPKISSAIQTVRTVLLGLANSFMETFSGVTVYAAELNKSVDPVSHVATATNKLGDALERSHNFFVAIRDVIVKVAKAVGSVLGPIFDSIKKKFDELSMQDIGALLTGGGLLIFARTIAKGLGSVDNILSNFSEILERVGDTIKAFQLKIKAEALLKIAIALAVLAGALLVLSSIDMADLAKGLGALTVLFAELVVGLKMLDKSTKTMGILQKQSKLQLVSLGASILILAFAAKTLASIPAEGLVKATTAIAALLGIVAMFTNFTKEGDLKKSTSGLIGLAIGITIFAGAIAILGNMDTNKLIQGGVAIASLMTVIALFINLTKSGDLKASAGGLVGFSVGILILTGSLAILANLDYDKLKQGMTSLGALMVMIALFINLTKGGELAKSAAGLVGFATGIALLTASLAILGSMDTGKLMQGAIAISTLMTVIGVFINVTKEGDLKGSASGLIGFAIGLTVLTGALVILGNMDNDKLKQGAEAIAALMGSIAVFIALTKEGDLKGSAAGLIGFAAGLVVMSGAVAVLAGIDSNRIVQGVSALVAVITSIGLFVNLTKGGDLKKSAAGLIGFSSGLMILAGVMNRI
jgi:hypothetical protein